MKRGRKQSRKEETKTEKQILKEEKSALKLLQEMIRQEQIDVSPAQLHRFGEQLMNKAHQQIDIPYLKTLLFPELYTADMPQPLCNISFTKFTDKQEGYLNPPNGEGMLLWFPKVNYGPSIFVYSGKFSDITSSWITATDQDYLTLGGFQSYQKYFTQTALCSGALSLQYTGQLQLEQGYMVGSVITGVDPRLLTVDDIENGQNRVITNPREGIRMVYLPKDQLDFSFYNASNSLSHNQGGRNVGDEDSFLFPMVSKNSSIYKASKWIGGSIPSDLPQIISTTTLTDIKYIANTEYIAIYWRGLPALQPLRVDSIRRFNGAPKSVIRDIVEVIKPRRTFDPKKTSDVINELQINVPQIAGHTIKNMDRVSDQIQSLLPNIGHLYNEGSLKEGTSLQALAQQLQLTGGNGTSTNVGMIWE